MSSKGTQKRSLRCGPIWDRAVAKAADEGTDLSTLIRDWITDYLGEPRAINAPL